MVSELDMESYTKETRSLIFQLRFILTKRERAMSVHQEQMVFSQKKWEDYLFLSWGMADIHEDLFIMIEK